MSGTASLRSLPLAVALLLLAAPHTLARDGPTAGLPALDRCLGPGLPAAAAAAACQLINAGAVRLDRGQRAALLHRLGRIALDQGRDRVAVRLLTQAHRLEPTVAPYLLQLADALLAAGEVDRAAAAYRAGLALAPSATVFARRLRGLGRAARPGRG